MTARNAGIEASSKSNEHDQAFCFLPFCSPSFGMPTIARRRISSRKFWPATWRRSGLRWRTEQKKPPWLGWLFVMVAGVR
jgi:hypothetical protein